MDEELRRLIDRLDQRLATGDLLSATFARELAAVWRDAERALRALIDEATKARTGIGIEASRGAVLLGRVRSILEQSGYDALVTASTSASADRLLTSVLEGQARRAATARLVSARATLNALREIATVDLLQQGDEVATALWRSLAQHLFTTRPTAEILQDLQDALDEDAATISTLFDTQVSIYGRQIEDLATGDLGPNQPFLYVGPIDDKTRPWCLERVGKVFTREEIEEMDNEQLPNPMVTAGGYNCRHSFMAVESQAMRDLIGTGNRVPVIAEDIARINQRKADKKRKAA